MKINFTAEAGFRSERTWSVEKGSSNILCFRLTNETKTGRNGGGGGSFVGALSPVNHKELHQGLKQTSLKLHSISKLAISQVIIPLVMFF